MNKTQLAIKNGRTVLFKELDMKIVSRKEAKAKGLKRYFTGVPCYRGHIVERITGGRGCIDCHKIYEKIYNSSEHGKKMRYLKQKRYRENNYLKLREQERVRSRTKKYRDYAKAYNEKNNKLPHIIEAKRKYNQMYRKKHSERLKESDRQYAKNVRRKNPLTKIREGYRRRILLALQNQNVQKDNPILKLLGCTIEKYIEYIEKQFYSHPKTKKKMAWKNRGLKGWHIDHIVPLCKFDLTKKSAQLKAFNYKNTQPMWAEYNLQKGSKVA